MKIIVDKNFIQSDDRKSTKLRKLVGQGYQLVLTDTLIFEVCSDQRRPKLWQTIQKKIAPLVDAVECWRHTSEIEREELDQRCRIKSVVDVEMTERFREMLTARRFTTRPDFQFQVERTRKEREVDSYESWKRCLKKLTELGCDRDLFDWYLGIVCSDQSLPSCIDDRWFIHSRITVELAAMRLYASKYGVRSKPGKKFVNTYHDVQYLALLNFADAIASDETRGDLWQLRSEIYGSRKRQISSLELLEE